VRLHISVDAQDDVDHARRYLNSQTAGLGDRFLEELGQVTGRIVNQPWSFPVLETLEEDIPIRRAILTPFSYIIAFEIVDDEIMVMGIIHQRQSIESWINRRRPR
jgi:plasmid stabilization system protein ParE